MGHDAYTPLRQERDRAAARDVGRFCGVRLAVVLFAVAIFVLAGGTQAFAMKKIRLALQWFPQAQFAGYYMAQAQGIYAKYGLDVDVFSPPEGIDSFYFLAGGEAEFCSALLTLGIEKRAAGMPVVHIGQIVQRSALMLVTRKSPHIREIQDLEGAKIGTWSEKCQLEQKALFKTKNINVEMVRQSPSYDLFMRGALDAVAAMAYNEYHRLITYGIPAEEMTTFLMSDYDMNIPEDGLYCLESTYASDPSMVTNFVRASIEGWEYAFANPEKTIKEMLRIMREAKVRANKAHQRWMLTKLEDFILPNGRKTLDTVLSVEDYNRATEILLSSGLIKRKPSYAEFTRVPVR